MIRKAIRWARAAEPWWGRFGIFHGTRCYRAVAEASWRAPAGTRVSIPMPEPLGPLEVRGRTSDVAVLHQLILEDELGFPLPFAPTRILDGGANIGIASRVFRARWPNAEIVAVELDPSNAALADSNLRADGVRIRNAGLWDREEPLQVANPEGEAWSRQAARLAAGGMAVRGLPIETLLDELGWDTVDLVKLDIEGAEVEVLRTSPAWLPRVRCLAIELHDRFRPGCSEALEAALAGSAWRRDRHGEYHVLLREPW